MYKKVCIECNEVYITEKHYQRFCSLTCVHKNQTTKKLVKCEVCGKEVYKTPYRLKIYKHITCSRKCIGQLVCSLYGDKIHKSHAAWNKGLNNIIKVCLYCEKKFHTLVCLHRKYCSQRCGRLAVASHRISSIEKIIKKELKKLQLKFISQWNFNKKWLADFYLSQYKLVIECDGDYFHQLQARRIVDQQKNRWLYENGYKILRLKEKEIKYDLENSLTKIRTTIGG